MPADFPAPRECIAGMTAYVPGEHPAGEAVKLNQNENPYPPSPRVAEAIAAALPRLRIYPDSTSRSLRRAAAEIYGVAEASVMAFNGSDEFLRLLFQTFADPGDEAVAFTPSYTYYRTLADMSGARLRLLPFAADYSLPPDPDFGAAKLVFLPNPNAPSGTLYPAERIVALCRAAPRAVVCVDEAYADFAGQTALPLLASLPNLAVSRTFSKGYGLAGLRAGLGFAAPELAAQMEKARDYYNLDVLAQAGAEAALRDREYLNSTLAKITATRARLAASLEELGFAVWPSAANFVLARAPAGRDAADLFEGLRRRRVYVRHFKAPRLEDCLRISVGTDPDIDRLLAVLRELLEN